MCFIRSCLESNEFLEINKPERRRKSIMSVDLPPHPNAAPGAVRQRFTPYFSSPDLTQRGTHEPHICSCDQCICTRLSRRLDASLPLDPNAERRAAENAHRERSAQQSPVIILSPPRSAEPPGTQEEMENVYIYPQTSHHFVIPVVDYTAKKRAESPSRLPACATATAPHIATLLDFETALSPPGSGFITVARLSKTKKTVPLGSFKNVEDLTRKSIQLEIWDEGVDKVSISTGNCHSRHSG
ncbi:hypothetical protein F5B19DRAFT_473916 [Rostrohypoxylon terebratum]|nr:hypothetical protein F5B19DRAFT_473916 [Rostrohypoxylon terebratum]